jgi:transcriptional regulator with XRE-family HTH domain
LRGEAGVCDAGAVCTVNRSETGLRIRRLRESKGLSRRVLASELGVDVTALASWEGGKYLPRDGHRGALVAALDTTIGALFAEGAGRHSALISAELIDTITELEPLLSELIPQTRILRALRIAAPYATSAHVQHAFRQALSERLLAGTIEVQRIEIFYSLERLKEAGPTSCGMTTAPIF